MSKEVLIAELMSASGVSFGTSGARGTVAAMTDAVCYAYTSAFLQHLEIATELAPNTAVAIAGDLRASTPRIMVAVARAIRDKRYRLIHCGNIPTPALAYHAMALGMPSIMVTGSHIPDDRNGIKFYRADGEILKADELAIRSQIVTLEEPIPERSGGALSPIDVSAVDQYIERYTRFFQAECLAGQKIGVYQHSGVARDLLATILEALGAAVVCFARSDQFVPVDTEAVREEDVALAKGWSATHGLDAIVSTDGDGDRPLIADEHGNWLRGDIVGILCAMYLGIDRIVTPVSSNSAVERCGAFISVLRTRIGSPYVIEGMAEICRDDQQSVAGYEANGGFLLATPVTKDGRLLTPLATRDAVLPILAVLAMAHDKGTSLSQLASELPARYTASGRLKAFPTQASKEWILRLTPAAPTAGYAEIEAEFGAFVGPIASTDSTDGLRIESAAAEIIHLRPSGNAPEFRCYTEAASEARAQELNQACLARMSAWQAMAGS